METIIGDWQGAVTAAERLITERGIANSDLIQCDTLCYRVETNERYSEVKQGLVRAALLLSEVTVNGRLIAAFALDEPLAAGEQSGISYIELPQPKPGSHYPEGIDHVQFVTRLPLTLFHEKYRDVPFKEKGLASQLNPLLKLEGDDVSVKFHDKHMGAVVELENRLQSAH